MCAFKLKNIELHLKVCRLFLVEIFVICVYYGCVVSVVASLVQAQGAEELSNHNRKKISFFRGGGVKTAILLGGMYSAKALEQRLK